jgi:lipopolysaccharide transport system permease protein
MPLSTQPAPQSKRASSENGSAVPTVVIRPSGSGLSAYVREIWGYRELLYYLTWRDMKIRYKQTVIGVAWAILQPALMAVIFTFFFGKLMQVPSQGVPYPIFVFAALTPWNLFASGVSRASNSLLYDSALIQKVYFPRLISPLSSILSPLIDFVFSFIVLIGLMLAYGYTPPLVMFGVIPLLALLLLFALGVGLWFAAMSIEYRDVGYIVPVLIQLLFFASPVIYAGSLVPEEHRIAYGLLNPMSGIIEGFRWATLNTARPSIPMMTASAVIIGVVLLSGIFYFRSREKAFADVV